MTLPGSIAALTCHKELLCFHDDSRCAAPKRNSVNDILGLKANMPCRVQRPGHDEWLQKQEPAGECSLCILRARQFLMK